MLRLSKISLPTLSIFALAFAVAGCGDNKAASSGPDGGTGGASTGGAGGGSGGKGGGGASGGQGGAGAVGGRGSGGTAGGGTAGGGTAGGGTAGGGTAGGGGGSAGMGGTGGVGTGGATVATCTGLAFTDPTNNQALTAANDASGDACGNGFQYNVTVAVTAPNGTAVSLIGTSGMTTTTLGTGTTTNGQARFSNVLLGTGSTTLSVKIGTMATACPTTATITVDCTAPVVSIVAPQADTVTFSDVSKHLLAATANQTFKDSSVASAGAQTTVVACTNRIGSARLFVGPQAGTLTQLGSAVNSVSAVAADNCPSGLAFIAKFADVTLPESAEKTDGTLDKATELRVDVTDAAVTTATGKSALRDVWVDTVVPTISEKTPTPFCGSSQPGAGVFTTAVALNASTAGVTLGISNGGVVTTQTMPAFAANVATFATVAFPQGQNVVVATATEPSGNATKLAPPAGMTDCTVTVGDPPLVTFLTPLANAKLCAATNTTGTCTVDGNAALPGWQGSVTVKVTTTGDLTGKNVTFTVGTATPEIVPIVGGLATLSNVTLTDAASLVVTAKTDDVATKGTGSATSSFVIDTVSPSAATALLATVIDRRQTSFSLDWKAPADAAAASYDIRVKTYDPTMAKCGTEVRKVTYAGTPKAAGAAENQVISNLFIENDYCFSIVAIDGVGNVSPEATTSGVARFNATLLNGTGTEAFGVVTDGTGDFGAPGAGGFANDRLSDLLVGVNAGQNAYLYFGRTGGYPTTPDVTFTGPANKRFGQGITAAGDIDGDGLTDIAISAPGAVVTDIPAVYIFSRKKAAWSTTGAWPATVDYTQASYVIMADSSYGLTLFGQIVTRIGNFDGAGADDLAISAFLYDTTTGTDSGRVIIVKGSSTFASVTLPDTTNTIVIDGEMAGDRFGRAMQALPDNTLIVSSPNALTSAGKLYAFRSAGLAQSNVANMTSAFDITGYSTANTSYGLNLATLGPLGPSLGVVVASATGAAGNFVDVHMVPIADGIFGGAKGSAAAPTVHLVSSITPNSLGIINIGSQVSGAMTAGSLIGGDSTPDLVVAGQGDATRTLFIISGAALTSMSGTVDMATTPPPSVIAIKNGTTPDRIRIPADWANFGRESSLVLDLNGDGYSDFSLSESVAAKPGRALVFW